MVPSMIDVCKQDKASALLLSMMLLTHSGRALRKYRVQLPGFELPEPVAMAQLEFDHHLATTLDGMADRMEAKSSEGSDNFKRSVKPLDQTIRTYASGKSHEVAAQFGTFLSLSCRIESLTLSLDEETQRKVIVGGTR